MGRRQKTFSNVSSTKAPGLSQKGLHRQSKMVLLPCYTQHSVPSISEDSLSRAKMYQTQVKLPVNPRCKSTITPISCHKEATTVLLPRIEHEVMLPHLETQTTIMPSPHSKHWSKATVITSSCPEYWATPLFGLNRWSQAPLISEHSLLKTPSGPDHLPKIPQGCQNPCEAQPLLNNWPKSPSLPDSTPRIAGPFSQYTHYQAKVTTEALPCLNAQPSLSSRHWDWATTSRFRCLNQRQKISAIPLSYPNNYSEITSMMSSPSIHQVRPITVPSACPPMPLTPMAMTVLTPVQKHPARVTSMPPSHDPEWIRATSVPLQYPNPHFTETPLIPHYNWVKGTFIPSKLPNQQSASLSGSYNLAEVLLVPDQQVRSLVGPEHPTEVLHFSYWVTPQPGPDQKVDMPQSSEHRANFTVNLNQQNKTLSDTSNQHEPRAGPDNEVKKLTVPDHAKIPEIHLNHSDETSLELNCKEIPSSDPNSLFKSVSGTHDHDEALSGCDRQDEVESDLDHKTEDTLHSNQNLEYQPMPASNLGQTVKGEEDPDHQDQPSLVSNQWEEQTTPDCHHGTTASDSDHPSELHLATKHQDILRLSPDYHADCKETSPGDLEKKSEHVGNPDNQYAPFPGFNRQTSPSNLKNQVKVPSNFHYPVKTFSSGLNHKAQKIQRDSSKSFTHVHSAHATESVGTMSKEFFNDIINSIPREKIKSDIQKQILLRRMRGYHNTQPGSHLSSSYTVCLACASWIPYGCPHINGTKDPYRAQLVVMPSPLPDSKDEMGIKYVLQVPQSKTGNIWDPSYFTSPTSSSCPHTMSLKSKIDHRLPKKMTWLNFILAKGDRPCGRKTFENKQQFKEKMSMNFSTPTQGARRNEDVVRSLLDRLKNKRTAN